MSKYSRSRTGSAARLDGTPTAGYNLDQLKTELAAAYKKLNALTEPSKEYDDFTEADWALEKQMTGLNMEICTLNSHIGQLEREQEWEAEGRISAVGGENQEIETEYEGDEIERFS